MLSRFLSIIDNKEKSTFESTSSVGNVLEVSYSDDCNTFQYCSTALRYYAISFLVQFSAEVCPWNSHIIPIFVAVWSLVKQHDVRVDLTW